MAAEQKKVANTMPKEYNVQNLENIAGFYYKRSNFFNYFKQGHFTTFAPI